MKLRKYVAPEWHEWVIAAIEAFGPGDVRVASQFAKVVARGRATHRQIEFVQPRPGRMHPTLVIDNKMTAEQIMREIAEFKRLSEMSDEQLKVRYAAKKAAEAAQAVGA